MALKWRFCIGLLVYCSILLGQKDTNRCALEMKIFTLHADTVIPGANIQITSNTGEEIAGKSDENGFFQTELTGKGDTFNIHVSAEGHLSGKGYEYYTPNKVFYHEYRLSPGCIGFHRIPSFKFEQNSIQVDPEADTLVQFLCDVVNDNPDINVELIGFSDATEDMSIREERCKSIKYLFLKKGCPGDRIFWVRGNDSYIIDEDRELKEDPSRLEEIRAVNRVVEIQFVDRPE